MRFTKVATLLIACLAMTAAAASVAQANWTIEGKTLPELGIEKESVEVKTHNKKPLTLTAEVGATKVEISAKSIECTAKVECTIDNGLGANLGKQTDHSSGQLTFTEVSVVKPSSCTVHSPGATAGTVTTQPLTDTVIMDPNGSTATFDTFFPETGTAFVNLEFGGGTCPFNELSLPVQGQTCGRAVHTSGTTEDLASLTKEQFLEQGLQFNEAEQKTAGCLLYLNNNKEKPAYLDATVVNLLSGKNKGKIFGAD
jgi:hypothetical protein